MYIKIDFRPIGAAPVWVREAWIGLTLPVLAGPQVFETVSVLSRPTLLSWLMRRMGRARPVPMRGFGVDAAPAFDALKQSNPEAWAWWRTNTPSLFRPGVWMVFDADCCSIVAANRD